LADRFKPTSTNAIKLTSTSVAVLPFENRSTQDNDAFFADGIHDELLTTLSRISDLDVISRTSVMGYRDTDKRIPDIAKELGVGAILEGAVQRSGDRVRITVQLINGSNDRHIWAESYDRPLSPENIFDIQGEITQVIASSLKGVLIKDEAIREDDTQNMLAYDAYLKARRSLDRAIALAPNELETYLAEAFYLYWGLSDYRNAEATFDKALSVAPGNVEAVAGQAFLTRRLGNFEAGLAGLEKAHRLDPASFYLIPEIALTHVFLGNFDKADAYVAKAKAMNPDSLQGHGFAAAVAQFKGDAYAAFDAFKPLAAYLPYTYASYALATQDERNVRAALAVWPSNQQSTPNQKAEYALAHLRAAKVINMSDKERNKHRLTLETLFNPAEGWNKETNDQAILIAAILGKNETVDRMAEQLPALIADDAVEAISRYSLLAESYMWLDQPEKALDAIEKMAEIMGPHVLRVFKNDVLYASIKNTPRWTALASYSG